MEGIGVMTRSAVAQRYARVRARTEALAAPLSPEDAMLQSMPDASPAKWHLAHTTWFFEEFVLARFGAARPRHDARWRILFNSYYEGAGPRHARAARGLLSRPSLAEVMEWRAAVDERVSSLLETAEEEVLGVALLGTHHEQQHQELLLTDVLHGLWSNPLAPAYAARAPGETATSPRGTPLEWTSFPEGTVEIGHAGESFAFDNETPRHRAVVGTFALGSRLVTNEEYRAFLEDGGYRRPELWLSDGWTAVQNGGWTAPLYWQRAGESREPAVHDRSATGDWQTFGLHGAEDLVPGAPVAHVSFYEADAFARWSGARLPTEQEWEHAARGRAVQGNFSEAGHFSPTAAAGSGLLQLFGDVWEWTASAYLPYPRFRPLQGVLGEYNGKFMSGQMVLRGGSCLSPRDHLRATYRNFFPPAARWQMTGIRLARDVS